MKNIRGILASHNINISQAIQIGEERENFVPVVITTDKTKYGEIIKAISNISREKLRFGSVFMISNCDYPDKE